MKQPAEPGWPLMNGWKAASLGQRIDLTQSQDWLHGYELYIRKYPSKRKRLSPLVAGKTANKSRPGRAAPKRRRRHDQVHAGQRNPAVA